MARAGAATVFPQAIGLAAMWDERLMHEVADTVSTEARAKYAEAMRRDQHERYQANAPQVAASLYLVPKVIE